MLRRARYIVSGVTKDAASRVIIDGDTLSSGAAESSTGDDRREAVLIDCQRPPAVCNGDCVGHSSDNSLESTGATTSKIITTDFWEDPASAG